MLPVNQKAPDIEGKDHNEVPFALSEMRGKWVVLYFYPKDETPGCVTEARGFRDRMPEFKAVGAEVVGVSVQDTDSHCAFAQHHRLNFRLLADTDKKIAKSYRALGLLGVARRVTYLIDPDGVIRDAYRSEVSPKSHVTHALDRIRELRDARS